MTIERAGLENTHVDRVLNPLEILKKKSCLLLGARQTGKSTIIRTEFSGRKVYNLLESDVFSAIQRNPALIRQELSEDDEIVVIDEIQLIPELLNEVHLMIEEHGVRFLLTGSSARKLKKKGINLLAGRARSRYLHPFTRVELKEHFELERALLYGLLPSVFFSDEPGEDLDEYIGTYLQHEISSEAVVRNVGVFSRFLEVAALCNGQLLNYSGIASDTEVSAPTVREYFQILEDTLIGFRLEPFKETKKRKPIVSPKFYFFDTGIVHRLKGLQALSRKTKEFGDAFEAYIFHELKTYCDYNRNRNVALKYWRSTSKLEVDFILGDDVAIEVKSKPNVTARDLKGLRALREEGLCSKYVVIALEDRTRVIDEVEILPYQDFLDQLWSGKLLG